MATLIVKAHCQSCNRTYRSKTDADRRSAVRAARANADVWAQTHRCNTGHARFEFVEVTSQYRIFGETVQMSLTEDPDLDLKDLGR